MKENKQFADNKERLEEVVNNLEEVQDAIMQKFNVNDYSSLVPIITGMAEKYHVLNSMEYKNLLSLVNELQKQIKNYKNGLNGEREAQKILKLISVLDGHIVMNNISAQADGESTEYDLIVINCNGITVIEVKNMKNDLVITEEGILGRKKGKGYLNVGVKMGIKEFILRKNLNDYFQGNGIDFAWDYHSYILFMNEESSITDNYHRVNIAYPGTICSEIRNMNSENKISEEQMSILENAVRQMHNPLYYDSDYDSSVIMEATDKFLEIIAERKDDQSETESNKKHLPTIGKTIGKIAITTAKIAVGAGIAVVVTGASNKRIFSGKGSTSSR